MSKWIGHRAYIEIVDDDDASIAVDEICLAMENSRASDAIA